MTTKDLIDPCEGMMLENLRRQRDELLAALKDCVTAAEYSDDVADWLSRHELGESINRARAAIRKAEGEAQR